MLKAEGIRRAVPAVALSFVLGACGTGTGESTSCVTWADVDFTIDYKSLDDRLVAGDGSLTQASDLATAEFLYS